MGYQVFLPILQQGRLNESQIRNVSLLIGSSNGFFRDAGIDPPEVPLLSHDMAVIESGHQPNFLPYPGIFKKIVFVDSLVALARENGIPAAGLFGFADQNLSTAPVLASNRLPSLTRDGFEKIGFKIREDDRWKQFRCIDRPSPEEFRKKMGYFENLYLNAFRDLRDGEDPARTRDCFGTLASCHERSRNFADMNAFLIATLSVRYLGTRNVLFFRYSDVQKGGILHDEARRLAMRREEFVSHYNKAVTAYSLQDIGLLDPAHVPFWYHCCCGRKLEIRAESPSCWRAFCEGCQKEYSFRMDQECRQIEPIYPDLGFTAVSRNLAFSEGFGVALFISGTGGSLRYGKISDKIGKAIGFRVPCTGAWGGRDSYLGPMQRKALAGLKQVFSLTDEDMRGRDLGPKISSTIASLSRDLEQLGQDPGNRDARKKVAGKLTNARTQLGIAGKLLSLTPSILDLLVSVQPEEILSSWRTTLHTGSFMQDTGVIRLQGDCLYPGPQGIPPSALPDIRKTLTGVGSVP